MCNREFMRGILDHFFDLVVDDPPYGLNINNSMGRRKGEKKSSHKKITWDNCAPEAEYFNELFRVSKDQVIWGANHFIDKIPVASSCWIVWDKMLSENVSFAQVELAWTSFGSTAKKFTRSTTINELKVHPTQKPVELYKWIYSKYTRQGMKIFDPHMGSQSSRIAAYEMGLDYYGCEKDTQYFELGCNRFEDYKRMETRLFSPEETYFGQQKLFT